MKEKDIGFATQGRYLEDRLVYKRKGEKTMLWTIILILLVLWALGFGFAGAAVGNLIHIILVVALVIFVVQLITGRRSV